MTTIIWSSVSKNFNERAPFREHFFGSSNNFTNVPTVTLWRVRTQSSLQNFIELMKLRYFFGEINNPDELRMFFDLPGLFNDELFLDFIKAREVVELNLLVKRYNVLRRVFFQQKEISKNLMFSLLGNMYWKIEEVRFSVRAAKNYSGYVRNSSAVGSKRSSGGVRTEPENTDWQKVDEKDFFQFLTVGASLPGLPGMLYKSP